MSGGLIVSLTSYPARFSTLHLTLACLLDQTVRADRTMLWISRGDVAALPASVRELEERGLEIRTCDDLRSYKKLLPVLAEHPGAYIVTADDDLYYGRDWLWQLVEANDGRTIVAHITHRIMRSASNIAPYASWPKNVQDTAARRASFDLLPTSGGGVLYPPGILMPRVLDYDMAQRLAPTADDLWYHWNSLGPVRKVGGKVRAVNWPGSQSQSLWAINETNGNDAAIAALTRELGYPEFGA